MSHGGEGTAAAVYASVLRTMAGEETKNETKSRAGLEPFNAAPSGPSPPFPVEL